MKKKFSIFILQFIFCSVIVHSQTATNSPYSQYGLGILSEQSLGFNRAMSGLSYGVRNSSQVNFANPASYSSVDSLTMLLDIGFSGQITSFKEGETRIKANNSDFDYIVASFRLMPQMGIGVGFVPFTAIGYNYSYNNPVVNSSASSADVYNGSGGVNQAFIGIGWSPVRNFSVGFNFSYLWGNYEKNVTIPGKDSYTNTITRQYACNISSYKLDIGVQYQHEITAGNVLTYGLTYGLGHKLGGDAKLNVINSSVSSGTSSSSSMSIADAYSLPHSFGVGATWKHGTKLLVGADYTLQKWGNLSFPDNNVKDAFGYTVADGLLKDRHKFVLGMEWVPNDNSRKYFRRVHYKMGISYATPYIKVNGQNGPKEYGVSAGFGFPLLKSGKSILNISGQWLRSQSSSMITEDYYRLNIGITFNERWFMKWKVQ